MSRLLIFDLAAVFRRAWHGGHTEERAILPDGRPFHGVHGTVLLALQAIKAHRPTELFVATEAPGSSGARRDLLPAYKAHRPPPDLDLVGQFRDTWSVFAAAGWPVVGMFRKEADDVVASAATLYTGEVVIVSGDRDLLALCSDTVSVALYRPGGRISDTQGPADCEKIFGVTPAQLCEYKALAGDDSDGIPGVNGIGPKSAAKILRHYGSLRDAFADPLLIGVPPQIRAAFRAGREQAQVSYRLAKMDTSLAVAGKWRSINECFGDASVDRVAALGFTETSRQFRRVPA